MPLPDAMFERLMELTVQLRLPQGLQLTEELIVYRAPACGACGARRWRWATRGGALVETCIRCDRRWRIWRGSAWTPRSARQSLEAALVEMLDLAALLASRTTVWERRAWMLLLLEPGKSYTELARVARRQWPKARPWPGFQWNARAVGRLVRKARAKAQLGVARAIEERQCESRSRVTEHRRGLGSSQATAS